MNHCPDSFLNEQQSPLLSSATHAPYLTSLHVRFWVCEAESECKGNLLFAGEHTSADYAGYMEEAVESGNRVAKELFALRKKKANRTKRSLALKLVTYGNPCRFSTKPGREMPLKLGSFGGTLRLLIILHMPNDGKRDSQKLHSGNP